MKARQARALWLGFAGVSLVISLYAFLHRSDPSRAPGALAGLQDFRDAVYYPVVAWQAGANPYDAGFMLRSFPVGDGFAAYTPLALVLHRPLAHLGPGGAALLYALFLVALLPLLAWLAIRIGRVSPGPVALAALSVVLLLSPPGVLTLFLGQCSLLAIVAAYLALPGAALPRWVMPLGLAIATFKPSFGIPLAIFLVAGARCQEAVAGLAAGALLAVVPLGSVVSGAGGPVGFLSSLRASAVAHDPLPPARLSAMWLRLDVPSLAVRWLPHWAGTLAAIGISLALLWWTSKAIARLAAFRGDPGAASVVRLLVCLGVLAAVPHHTYDALLLAAPLLEVATRSDELGLAESPLRLRLLIAAMVVPFVNYFAACGLGDPTAHGLVRAMLGSANGLAVLLAWGTALVHAQRYTRMGDEGAIRKAVFPRAPRPESAPAPASVKSPAA